MHMVAIGWLWVVFMIAITAKSFVSGALTFLFYGLAPGGLFLYWLIRQTRKRHQHEMLLRQRQAQQAAAETSEVPPSSEQPEQPD
ncbi:MAG TPA: hypothetical protein VGN52_20470 [Burkholderiales bacterium]